MCQSFTGTQMTHPRFVWSLFLSLVFRLGYLSLVPVLEYLLVVFFSFPSLPYSFLSLKKQSFVNHHCTKENNSTPSNAQLLHLTLQFKLPAGTTTHASKMNGQGNRDDEYREMVEIDVQRQHQQQHEQRQQQQQEYFQQDLHSPYGPPERSFTPYSPYQSSVEDMQQGRSITEQGRPARPSQAHFEDYSPAPEWPPQIANSPGQYFNDTPGGSRSATPSLRSGQETPARLHYHAGNSSVDWRPSSLMVPSPSTRTLVNKSSSVTDQSYRDKQNQSHLSLAALLPNGASTQNTSSQTLAKEYIVDTSAIQHVHKRDDVEIWKGWKRWVFKLVPLLTFMNTGFYMAYLALRIACVIWAQNAAGMTYEGAWVFIAVEIAVAIPSLMHNTWTMWSMKKRQRPKLRVTGNDVPTVDAFVTCCGEDDDLVMDTVRAACDLDYPQDRFRVIILDDGKSAGLEEQCAKLSMTYPNLYYMARVKIPGQPHHFKAGNLNYGLDEVHKLPGGAGQFMAALDADMVSLAISMNRKHTYNSRFPSVTGSVLSFLTFSSTPRWLSPAHLNSSTTRLLQTLSPKVSTSSCTSSSPLRMLSASHGAQDPATSHVAKLSTRSATSLLDLSLKMLLLRRSCSVRAGRRLSSMSLCSLVPFPRTTVVI